MKVVIFTNAYDPIVSGGYGHPFRQGLIDLEHEVYSGSRDIQDRQKIGPKGSFAFPQ